MKKYLALLILFLALVSACSVSEDPQGTKEAKANTSTPTATFTPTVVPTLGFAHVTAKQNLPIYNEYGVKIFEMTAGTTYQVIAENSSGMYFQIVYTDGIGWISSSPALVERAEIPENLQTAIYPAPTATPMPSATLVPSATPLPTATIQPTLIAQTDSKRLDTCPQGSHFDSKNPHPLSGRVFEAYGENSVREPSMDMVVNDCGWYHQPNLQPYRPLAAVALEFTPGTYTVFGGEFYLDAACEGLGTDGVLMSDHQHGSTFVVEIPEGITNSTACGLVIYDWPGSANGGSFQFQWRMAPIAYNGVVQLYDAPSGNPVNNTVTASMHIYAVEISEDEKWVLLQQGLNENEPTQYGGSIWGWAPLAPMVANRAANFNDQGVIFIDDYDFLGLPRSCDIEGRNRDCQVNTPQ